MKYTAEENLNLIKRVVDVFDSDNGGPGTEEIIWRTDCEDTLGVVMPMINCNDLFAWGFADCEWITLENIDLLESTFKELSSLETKFNEEKGVKIWEKEKGAARFMTDASILFCCRYRKSRPQVAYYKHFHESLKPLFDACGTEEQQYGSEAFYDKIEKDTGKKLEWRVKHKS
jgi:hypothetical protein